MITKQWLLEQYTEILPLQWIVDTAKGIATPSQQRAVALSPPAMQAVAWLKHSQLKQAEYNASLPVLQFAAPSIPCANDQFYANYLPVAASSEDQKGERFCFPLTTTTGEPFAELVVSKVATEQWQAALEFDQNALNQLLIDEKSALYIGLQNEEGLLVLVTTQIPEEANRISELPWLSSDVLPSAALNLFVHVVS